MSYITYEDDELHTPTFHCDCGVSTEGFTICLKCDPQTYTTWQDEVEKGKALTNLSEIEKQIEALQEMLQCSKNTWNAAIEAAAKVLEQSEYDDVDAIYMVIVDRIRSLKK